MRADNDSTHNGNGEYGADKGGDAQSLGAVRPEDSGREEIPRASGDGLQSDKGTPEKSVTLISEYQLANRRSYNFATGKTKFGWKCINLPANEIAAELRKREPDQELLQLLYDDLRECAVAEFRRWEERAP